MIIDGQAVAAAIEEEIKAAVSKMTGRKPALAVVLVGDHPASQIYTSRKAQACERVGIRSIRRRFPADISQEVLLQELDTLNADPEIDGILVQLPLPQHINPITVTHHIDPKKDVDGFHPLNVGKMLIGEEDGFLPCTPLGIKVLLERSSIPVSGKHVVILGRSNMVGKPMAAILIQKKAGANATVTIAHSQSDKLKNLCLSADILIVAIGQPHFVKADMVREGSVVVDVGVNKIEDPSQAKGYAIVGDVDFAPVQPKCAAITPVPGGVGPMTIAMLLNNTLKSYGCG